MYRDQRNKGGHMGWHGGGKMVGQRGQLGSGITHTHIYIVVVLLQICSIVAYLGIYSFRDIRMTGTLAF